MWPIIKAELKYTKTVYLSFVAFIPLLLLIENTLEDLPNFLIWLLIFLTQFYYLIFLTKEKRFIRHTLLPVSKKSVGFARIMILLTLMISMLGCYGFIGILLAGGAEANPHTAFKFQFMALVANLSLWTLFYILRDIFLYHLRHNRFIQINQERARNVLIFMALLLNLLGVYINIAKPKVFLNILDRIFSFRISPLSAFIFFLLSLLLIYFSVQTFIHRKSYLEI